MIGSKESTKTLNIGEVFARPLPSSPSVWAFSFGFEGLAPLGHDSRLTDHGPQTGGAWHRNHFLISKCMVDVNCYEKLYLKKLVVFNHMCFACISSLVDVDCYEKLYLKSH